MGVVLHVIKWMFLVMSQRIKTSLTSCFDVTLSTLSIHGPRERRCSEMMVGEAEDGNTVAEQRVDGSNFHASQIGRLNKNYFLAVLEPNFAPNL
jgi:hypothetical protein